MASSKAKTTEESQNDETGESCTGATDNQDAVTDVDAEDVDAEDVDAEDVDAEDVDAEDTDTEDSTENPEDIEEEAPVHLVAIRPILFESHMYKPGDVLPAHNSEMNEAWVKAKTAEWRKIETSKPLRAVPASAVAGLTGNAIPSSKQDLIGRVPGRGRK